MCLLFHFFCFVPGVFFTKQESHLANYLKRASAYTWNIYRRILAFSLTEHQELKTKIQGKVERLLVFNGSMVLWGDNKIWQKKTAGHKSLCRATSFNQNNVSIFLLMWKLPWWDGHKESDSKVKMNRGWCSYIWQTWNPFNCVFGSVSSTETCIPLHYFPSR
jgi:hypothetical protein